MVWSGAAAGLLALRRRSVVQRVARVAARPALAIGFVVLVAVGAVVAYPVFDGRSASGGGSDADDGVFVVLDGLRHGGDPYASDTYLGNAPTTGPGSALWFLPFGTRRLYPLGIAAAIALTMALVRWAHDEWQHAGMVAMLLGASVPFWEGVGQGSDHLVIGCSLVWAACALRPRGPGRPLDPRVVVAGALLVGTLSTARAVFGVVPLLCAAALWWRDRRAALLFGGVGTAVVLALHAWFVSRSSWDGYDPVQQLLVKSGDELPDTGKALLLAGLVVGGALTVLELRRRAGARVEVVLLAGVVTPMSAIALAGLTAEPIDVWSGANYLLDGVALTAYWVSRRLLAPPPSPSPPPR